MTLFDTTNPAIRASDKRGRESGGVIRPAGVMVMKLPYSVEVSPMATDLDESSDEAKSDIDIG